MSNYELQAEEVVLYEGTATADCYKGNLLLTLTSQKLVMEKEKGLFKKEKELVDIIPLDDIKYFNDEAQIKKKGNAVSIQTVQKNITLTLSGMIEATKFTTKIMTAATGTSLAKRGSNKVKDAFNLVDDTLGLDTRETIKGVLENGVAGTILKGIKKK